ncbi:MAG: methylated-DNA--[protein]-cysteine S-methyltransferase [Thermoleophilia bacterium]|nr:methylated-DNA--[protein]-cysteine S-methyltransferase [Thermoleophilia bacterium]
MSAELLAYMRAGGSLVNGGSTEGAELRRWVAELEAYFRGARLSWSPAEIDLERLGFPGFALAVYRALLTVPPAVTISYGALAELAGYPRAARAVGNVLAANPLPVVIPCHRVIRADGHLGRYGSDSSWKGRLLAHETYHLRGGGHV